MQQKPILFFKPVDALKPFHQLLASAHIFEMCEDMDISSVKNKNYIILEHLLF